MFILASPAGKEINVLMTGKILEKKTTFSPYLRNHRSERLYSCSVMSKYLPYFCIQTFITFSPAQYPSQNAKSEPTKLATAPTMIIQNKLNCPVEARKPEKVIVISEGMGIRADSDVISRNIPQYPVLAIKLVIK